MERTPPPQLQVVKGKHEHKPGSVKGIQVEHIIYSWDLGVYA